jgi:3D (Asp-Asp-Asp) domain-containing protein/cell division protein ZapA (FtsZ GTPase activity inhibitor)
VLASAAVRGRRETCRAPALILAAGLILALALPGAGGADPSQKADALRRQQTELGTRSHAALVGLYSLDSRLVRARAQLATLEVRSAEVRAEQARVVREEAIARQVWQRSVAVLGAQLRTLYEHGQPDAIAILVGATSIDDAMTRLDALQRNARLSRATIAQTRAAQHSLARLRARLAARAADLQRLLAQAEQTTTALEQARTQRVAYLASLAHRRDLNARQIKQLAVTSHEIAARSQTITAEQETVPIDAPTTSPDGRVLTVSATGYSLPGSTATGMPVGWGIVAVDPAVIPLGTRMTIPGYGEGVAADVGSAVRGASIDLWFPTLADARSWGRRTVTITLH